MIANVPHGRDPGVLRGLTTGGANLSWTLSHPHFLMSLNLLTKIGQPSVAGNDQ